MTQAARRAFLTRGAAGLLGVCLAPRWVAAQAAGTTALTESVSLVATGRTNVLVLAAPDGLVLVDSGAPELTGALLASLRQQAAPPSGGPAVRVAFNTHWHQENTGGNEALRAAGAAVIAHENTRLWMATPTWIPAENRYRQPRPAGAHPTRTFYDTGTMTAGGERIDYGYLLEPHTSADIYVFFRNANVLAVGDVAAPVRDPEFDYFTGAWIGGRVDALDRLLALADDRTRIVPGFGPVMTRAELRAERDLMKTIYDRTVERVRQGDGPADMLDGGVLGGLPRTWKDPQKFLYDLHKGLWAHHNKLNADVV